MKLKNNKKAVNDLWHEFEPYIRKLCEYKLQSLPNHIDDCVQEVFLDLADALHKGKKIEYPKAWLTKVANNKIKDIYSQAKKDAEKLFLLIHKISIIHIPELYLTSLLRLTMTKF